MKKPPARSTLSRRHWLGQTGIFALASQLGWRHLFAASPQGLAKRCVVLWMNGGPSQLETLDPKPGAATGGPTRAIATSTPGLQLSEHLPRVAERLSHMALIRNLSSQEGEHQRAQHQMHTGFSPQPTFPRPTFGAIVSHETPAADFPKFVSMGSRGYGPAFLGAAHAPWEVGEPREAMELLLSLRKRKSTLKLIDEVGKSFRAGHEQPVLESRQSTLQRIQRMLETSFVQALDIQQESAAVRGRYGDHLFGRQCLAAKRLLQAGVRFVEVQLDGWDTHQNNFATTKGLCQRLDPPWAALLDDLKAEGLLDETLVVWMGEFGRTPQINANQGRDHFPAVTPVALAGAGIRGGQAIGATNATGTEIDGPSLAVADLFASMLHAFGISPDHAFTTAFGSPTTATNNGAVIESLFSGR